MITWAIPAVHLAVNVDDVAPVASPSLEHVAEPFSPVYDTKTPETAAGHTFVTSKETVPLFIVFVMIGVSA